MSWFRNVAPVLALLLLGSGMLAAKDEVSAKEADKSEGKKDKKKEEAGAAAESLGEKNAGKIAVPVPPGHDAKGLVIPMRNEAGQMQMRFTMEIGKRTDADHMEMTTLLIESFDDEGKEEMKINLPQSRLDLNTRVISTESGVLIQRSDFELSGKSMVFNTETKAGRVAGKVRMLIYNLDHETSAKPKETPRAK